jgi:hypothetical protein
MRLINLKGRNLFLARAKTPTRQTVLLKKVFLRKLDFFIFVSRSLPGWPNAVVVCHPPSSFLLVVRRLTLHAVIICHLSCLPLLLSTIAIVAHHRHRHPPPPCSAITAIIATLLSLPSFATRSCSSPCVLVRHPISHAVVFRSYHCSPLPLSSATTVYHCHSHHHQSAFSAISHRSLLSFSIAVCRSISHVALIRHHRHPLPPLSAVAVPPLLVLPPTLRC